MWEETEEQQQLEENRQMERLGWKINGERGGMINRRKTPMFLVDS
jgi:hypothetical protein